MNTHANNLERVIKKRNENFKSQLHYFTSTTSFLTATTLIYAIGAGITAAAGTRLALQLFIDKCCALFSIQLQNKSSAL